MSQRENVNPIREQDHRKNSRRYQKRAAARRRRNTIFIMEIVLLLILAVVLFFVSKLSKIEKTKLDMDKIEVNEDISQESRKIMKGYQTIAMFGPMEICRRGGAMSLCLPILIMIQKR